jgi:hypothetical protein
LARRRGTGDPEEPELVTELSSELTVSVGSIHVDTFIYSLDARGGFAGCSRHRGCWRSSKREQIEIGLSNAKCSHNSRL